MKPESVPTVKSGQTFTFSNLDADVGNGQWHTITACKAPCNKSTGIAYPLADGPVIFDCLVEKHENCFPMIPSGKAHNEMLLGEDVSDEEVGNAISAEGKVLV